MIDTTWHPLADGRLPSWGVEWAVDRLGGQVGIYIAFEIEGVQQRMRWIRPGTCLMGSTEQEWQRYAEDDFDRHVFATESPQHEVTISRGFWLADTPCTQALWEAVMGKAHNPSRFKEPRRPVESVSWDDVQGFLERVNDLRPDLALTLPTEAQWEYACRARSTTATYGGELELLGERNAPVLDPIAWYGGNSGIDYELEESEDSSRWPETQYPHERAGSRPVGLKRPNPWGLYDMLGNVREWCADGRRNYSSEPATDPVGPTDPGTGRVFRGGSWRSRASRVRAAYRKHYDPGRRLDFLGFRCARGQE